jgi:hypothetical protein
MSTPTDQQAEKEKKPMPRRPAAMSKRKPAASQPERALQRPAQEAKQTPKAQAQSSSQPLPKAAPAPAPKAATPPAPKPRDPSVARRDERREARRLEIQARQQERHRELQQVKRQKRLIRADLIIAPIVLIGLVTFFAVIQQPIDALISGVIVVFAALSVLAFATLRPTRTSRLARPRTTALPDATVIDSTASEGAAPPEAQPDQRTDQANRANE